MTFNRSKEEVASLALKSPKATVLLDAVKWVLSSESLDWVRRLERTCEMPYFRRFGSQNTILRMSTSKIVSLNARLLNRKWYSSKYPWSLSLEQWWWIPLSHPLIFIQISKPTPCLLFLFIGSWLHIKKGVGVCTCCSSHTPRLWHRPDSRTSNAEAHTDM